ADGGREAPIEKNGRALNEFPGINAWATQKQNNEAQAPSVAEQNQEDLELAANPHFAQSTPSPAALTLSLWERVRASDRNVLNVSQEDLTHDLAKRIASGADGRRRPQNVRVLGTEKRNS
ncbi:MAG TPA: hypothetical protein VMV10_07890, partial [Pirellulales bacterium]|nr:hypothetical protein [Pirellulales bacterium]